MPPPAIAVISKYFHAKQLGVDIAAVRWKLILAVSLLVGGAVALGGMIGFIGLVIPHLLRMALGTENKYLLPLSALCGGAFLVVLFPSTYICITTHFFLSTASLTMFSFSFITLITSFVKFSSAAFSVVP